MMKQTILSIFAYILSSKPDAQAFTMPHVGEHNSHAYNLFHFL